jgi:murein DD-endopeptidase MepM/ murein hydrolase activator NlpD
MRSSVSSFLPLYLSVGALCAGLGIQAISPAATLRGTPAALPRLTSLPQVSERLAAMQQAIGHDIGALWAMPSAALSRTESFVLRRGDTLNDVLERAGLTRANAAALVQAVHGIYNPKRMHVGQAVELTYNPLVAGAADAPARLAFEIAPGHRVSVERQDDGAYEARNVIAPRRQETTRAVGTISSSLFEAAEQQRLPAQVLAAFVKMFSYDVDFQRDIQKGDRFEVMYDREVTDDGRSVSNGAIRYASLTVGGEPLKFYAFRTPDGDVEYYNEKGEGVRKALMRTPVNGATLTSGFGMRKHPILGYSIMHRGVDFGAPVGTPIMAAGDGIVEKRENSSTYGNYVRIRHGSGYATAYGHLSRFAAALKAGKRVHQGEIIGYVGATGRATGPHLHFEVLRDQQQVNPISVKFPAAMKLDGALLARFRSERGAADQLFAALGAPKPATAEAGATQTAAALR